MGQIYLVTFVTFARVKLFLDPGAADACVRSLVDPRNWQSARLLAWVLMPDHWHGLVELGARAELSHLVRHIKACSARDIRIRRPDVPAVWQVGFHDHALRQEEGLVDLARYVVLNPVRAGLVARVGEYPYWDSVWRDS